MLARRLSALQERVLTELAGMEPSWTLFGAGALIGFYLGHRTTRDLDLAFRPLVGEIPREVEPPTQPRPGVHVDTARELLAQKLSALLSRTELRDLEDVGALLDAGGDLAQGLRDAAARDGGFSPPTLAWLLQAFPIERAQDEGRDPERLDAIRSQLLAALRA